MYRELLSTIADGADPLKDPVQLFIFQLVFILIVSTIIGVLFRYIKQPQVIAEIIAGIILGPSILGNKQYGSRYMAEIFPSSSLGIISVIANIGLIFFMFLIGIELDITLLKKNAKPAAIIAVSSIAVPFGLGSILSIYLYEEYPPTGKRVEFATFLLFVGVAMSITAFPVLARILTEQHLTSEKIGLTSLSAAAVNDVVAWLLLAIVVSIANATSPLSTVYTLIMLAGFLLLMGFGVRPLLARFNDAAEKSARRRHQLVLIVFILILASSWFTSAIGVHVIFGGFVMGVISPRDKGFAIYITERIEDVIIIILLPLYFTLNGLKTDLSQMNTGKPWGICLLVIIIACFGKIVGSMVPTKLLGNTWRESVTVGILMNTKGLVELIVLNLGKDVGVLSSELFDIFVMMAIVTTMITSPLLHFTWIRAQRIKAAPLLHESFSILMCISNQVSGLALASIAGTLAVQRKKKFTLQALHVTEVTDSPSSYFFAHKKPPPAFLELVKERARALAIPLKFKQIFAVNVQDDIDYFCSSKNLDMILIARNEPLLETGTGTKVKTVLAHSPSTVAVLINKGVHEIVNIAKVLVIYTGEKYQKDALRISRMMCRKSGVQVTLMSSVRVENFQTSEIENMNFIYSESPIAQGIEESRQQYDLIVVGISREWGERDNFILQLNDLLALSPVSVLLVHPRMEGIKKRKFSIQIQNEEPARLFLGGGSIPLDGTGHNKGRRESDDDGISIDNGSEYQFNPQKPHNNEVEMDELRLTQSRTPRSNNNDTNNSINRNMRKSLSQPHLPFVHTSSRPNSATGTSLFPTTLSTMPNSALPSGSATMSPETLSESSEVAPPTPLLSPVSSPVQLSPRANQSTTTDSAPFFS